MAQKPSILKIETSVEVYDNYTDLSASDQALIAAARQALSNAYAPYSGFSVGAAVLLAGGEVVTGNNQENAAYPSGLCAERVAVFYASSRFPGAVISTIAIACRTGVPVAPCGSCRQAIAEYEVRGGNNIRIIMCGESGKVYVAESITSLLPLMFNRSFLS